MEQPINEPFTSEESQEIYQNFKTIINSRLDKLYNSKGSDGEQYAYSIAVKQMRKKQAEKLAEPTPEEPMEQGDKLKEMIQSALSKPLSEKKKSPAFTSKYDDTLNEIENAEDFSDLVYKDMWNDLLAWAKSNRTSSRKNAKYPSESKQEAYLLSIAPKYQVDVNILKKALKQYDDLHNRTYGMIPGGLTWQEWVDAKINKYSNKNSNNFMKFEEGKKEDVTGDGKIDSKDYLAKRDIAIQKAKSKVKEDLDLGHEDNEPHMLKADLYRIGKYAMELYKMVDQFEGEQEVDFPHWWQAKIIEAKNMLVSAKHYLDFEIKEPQLDAMVDVASEEGAIDESLKEKIKEAILAKLKNKPPVKENFFMGKNPYNMGSSYSDYSSDSDISIDILASKIAKALKNPKNQNEDDQNNIKQARKALNLGDIEVAEKIAKPYIT